MTPISYQSTPASLLLDQETGLTHKLQSCAPVLGPGFGTSSLAGHRRETCIRSRRLPKLLAIPVLVHTAMLVLHRKGLSFAMAQPGSLQSVAAGRWGNVHPVRTIACVPGATCLLCPQHLFFPRVSPHRCTSSLPMRLNTAAAAALCSLAARGDSREGQQQPRSASQAGTRCVCAAPAAAAAAAAFAEEKGASPPACSTPVGVPSLQMLVHVAQ